MCHLTSPSQIKNSHRKPPLRTASAREIAASAETEQTFFYNNIDDSILRSLLQMCQREGNAETAVSVRVFVFFLYKISG